MGCLKWWTQQCQKIAKKKEFQTMKNNNDIYFNDNLGSDDRVSIDDEIRWTNKDKVE